MARDAAGGLGGVESDCVMAHFGTAFSNRWVSAHYREHVTASAGDEVEFVPLPDS